MKKILRTTVAALLLALTPATLVTSPVYAASCGTETSAKGQVLKGIGQTGNSCNDSQIDGVIKTAVNILSILAGVIAIFMIIYSGVKYTTSGGDSSKVSSAKSSLIFALVGLIIAALAQFLVRVVLAQSSAGLP